MPILIAQRSVEVDFGHGTTGVGRLEDAQHRSTGVYLCPVAKHTVGQSVNHGAYPVMADWLVTLRFDTSESVEVLQDALETVYRDLKRKEKNEKRQLEWE